MKCVQLRTWSGGTRGSFFSLGARAPCGGGNAHRCPVGEDQGGDSQVPSDLKGVPSETVVVGVCPFPENDVMRWRKAVRRVVGANPL